MYSIEWKISRDLPVSIHEQIKGQIIYSISFGKLQSGDPLPSVREMANILNISPVTVSKVYRDLTQEGLLVSKRSVGVFVNELGLSNGNKHLLVSKSNLIQILENSIRQAKLMGYSLQEIHDTFHAIANQYKKQREAEEQTLIMVGNTITATTSYAVEIQKMLHDLNVKVLPFTYDDLIHCSKDLFDKINTVKLVITLPERLREVGEKLSDYKVRVVAIAFELSPDTIQKLSSITINQRVGIVSTNPDFVQVMVDELVSYGLSSLQPKIALVQNMDRVRSMLQEIDALIYATGSEKVLEILPEGLTALEFLHKPKLESVNRLRSLLVDELSGHSSGTKS
jgi:DNA-binding transcriptional regulator YhcF (GntR family)